MRGLVLAYHAQNCGGFDYASNDHIAFAADLEVIQAAGLPLVALPELARCLATGQYHLLPERFVGLSCDDGTSLDWQDYQHPAFGPQKSLANILRDHLADHGVSGRQLLSAFVIASAEARECIDLNCYNGAPLSDDGWWPEAAADGLLSIQNHSWDHLHEVLPADVLRGGSPGDFYSVDSYAAADVQLRQSREAIEQRLAATGGEVSLFAYPYGHASAYLRDRYLPQFAAEHKMTAAFTTEQGFVSEGSNVYALPRMVCGDAWSSPAQFDQLLQQLLAS